MTMQKMCRFFKSIVKQFNKNCGKQNEKVI